MGANAHAVAFYFGALWLVCAWGWWRTLRRARRRHGGYLPRSVFTSTNPPTGTQPETGAATLRAIPADYSSMMRLGTVSAAPAEPPTTSPPSNSGAHGFSTVRAAGNRGGTPPAPADYGDFDYADAYRPTLDDGPLAILHAVKLSPVGRALRDKLRDKPPPAPTGSGEA